MSNLSKEEITRLKKLDARVKNDEAIEKRDYREVEPVTQTDIMLSEEKRKARLEQKYKSGAFDRPGHTAEDIKVHREAERIKAGRQEGIEKIETKKQRLEKLRGEKAILLEDKKRQLETERTKAEIKKLKQETGFFGKLKREHAKIKARTRGKPRTVKTIHRKKGQPTVSKSVTKGTKFELVDIDGKLYKFNESTGELTKITKTKKKKKKKEEWTI